MPPKLADNVAEVAVVIPLWSRGCLGWLLEAGSFTEESTELPAKAPWCDWDAWFVVQLCGDSVERRLLPCS